MAATFLVSLPVSLTGCTPKAQEVSISRILIDAPAELDADQRARAALRATIRARLEADDSVAGFVRRPQATHRLRIRAYSLVARAGGEGLPFGEGAKTPGRKGAAQRRPIEVALQSLGSAPGFATVGDGGDGADLVAAIEKGFADAWPVLLELRRLHVQKDPALIAAIDDLSDVRVATYAVEQLGERRSEAAVEPLVRLLGSDRDQNLVLRAVGALVAIGDEAAVLPLIDMTYHKEPRFVLQIVFAVSAIGGRTAEGFLVTLASGHPHPEIQRGAKDALAEMKKRRGARGG